MKTLADLFNILRMPAGRRTFALRKVRSLAGTDAALLTLVDAAISQDAKTLQMRGEWLVTKDAPTKYPARLIELDVEHDRLVASFNGVAQGLSAGMTEDTPIGAAARRVVARVFAAGVAPLTQIDFVQQLASTKTWLALLNGELSDDVVLIGLQPMRDRLVEVNKEFGDILDAFEAGARVTYDAWRNEDLLGQERMLRVVAYVAGKYNGAKDGDDAMREKLLAPILQQNEAVADTYRKRRAITDVDPDDGQVVTDPVA